MEYLIFAAGVGILLLLLMAKGFYDHRKEEKRFVIQLQTEYGRLPRKEYNRQRWQSIPRYHQKHVKGFVIDDITWNDLDMDEVFKQLDGTFSAAGEEYLYHLLRTPCMEEEELLEREKLITYFMEQEKERISCQLLFSKLGYTGKFSLYDYLDYLDRLGVRHNGKHLLAIVLMLMSICLMFYQLPYGLLAFVCVLIYNYLSYFRIQKEIEPYLTSFSYLFRLLRAAEQMQARSIPVLEEDFRKLRRMCDSMKQFRRGSFLVMSPGRATGTGSPLDMLFDFLRMGTHADLIKFNQMLEQVRKHLSEIDEILTILGRIDAMIAIGAYRAGHDCTVPEFADRMEIETSQVYHPLVTEPVKNDFYTKKSILITGSNASGKSTFLKTISLNAILSQTIHTVLADRWKSAFWRVCTSMALRDDLQSGSSYYMEEIKSVKRILELGAEDAKPVLCFIDEVLRGTNTVERIAASVQILRKLSGENSLCFAATHDVELTHLLENVYENYHFSEEMDGDDIFFSYQIIKGRSESRNAIRLLGVMGYDSEIIREAETLAQEFLETGSWPRLDVSAEPVL